MSALADLVALLKSQTEAKNKAAAAPPAPAPTTTRNPNAERFAFLHSAEAAAEGNSRDVEKPREVLELEARHGKGIVAGRVIRAVACAQKFYRHEDPSMAAVKVIHNVYKDKATAKFLEEAIEKDLSANLPNEGGYLIPEVVNDSVVELLYPKVVIFRLGATEVPMVNGNLHQNYVESGTTAEYVGEGGIASTSGVTFGQASWRSKKLVSTVPISNDLLKVPSAKADKIVLADSIKQMAVRMNRAAWQDDGSNNTPRGLKYETGLVAVTLSGVMDSDDPVDFMVALEDALMDLDSMTAPGWAMNHKLHGYLMKLKDLNGQYYYRSTGRHYADASGNASGFRQKSFEGYNLETTQLIPTTGSSNPYTTDLYFGDWSEYWVPRQGMLEIDSSDVAAYNTGPSTVVSAFSKDQTVIRVIDRHDMGMRQRKAMARASVTFNQ